MVKIALLAIVSLLLIPASVFARGQPDTAAGELGAGSSEPQYGGTLTPWVNGLQALDPPSPWIEHGFYAGLMWLDFIQESPVVGDVETYGPVRGNGECSFQFNQYVPKQCQTGNLAESWEISPERIVFHVRPGVFWAADNVDWMESRELTAEDMALDMTEFWQSPWGGRFEGIITDIRAEGNTVVVDLDRYSAQAFYWLSYEDRALTSPPEMTEAGPEKWANQIGTGPFTFEEYVVGSHMSFERNPNYWKSTTVAGVEYELPFLDRVVVPIIPDASTQMASLQTGLLDLYRLVPVNLWDTLDAVAPRMEKSTFSIGNAVGVGFRVDLEPFDDVNVRKALMIGTDREEFAQLYKAEDLLQHYWPILPGSFGYTPMEDLPEDYQRLYDYNPELAKQMLADAGYPNGFESTLMVQSNPDNLDAAALFKDQWAKIGVDLTLDVREPVAFTEAIWAYPPDYVPKYTGAALGGGLLAETVSGFAHVFRTRGPANASMYYNPALDDLIDRAQLELDLGEQERLIREAADILMRDFIHVSATLTPNRNYWWPWVKNYYGEVSLMDDATMNALIRFIWIDEALKSDMGF